jgi:hypothetical protein
MPASKYAAIGILLVLAAGVVLARWLHAPHADDWRRAREPVAVRAVDSPLASVEAARQLAEVRQELSRLRAEVRTLSHDDRAAPLAAASNSAPPSAEPLSREEQELRFVNYMAAFDRTFHDEPRDHAWAETTGDAIRAVAASEQMPPDLVADIDCRSRTCKVELVDADARSLDKGIDLLIHELAQTLPNARIGHDGDVKNPKPVAVYFTRASPEDSIPAVARQ